MSADYKAPVFHVKDDTVHSRKGKSGRTGRDYELFYQEALLDMGEERRKVEIPCRNAKDGLGKGSFELLPFLKVDNYGRVELDMRASGFKRVEKAS